MRKFLFVFLFLPVVLQAQVENARKTVETLCSPEFHGRGYVNGGDSIAAEYIAQQFKAIGCKFYKKNPFQPFNFRVNTFPSKVELAISFGENSKVSKSLHPGTDFVVAPNCGSVIDVPFKCHEVSLSMILHPEEFKALSETLKKEEIAGTPPMFVFKSYEVKGDTLKQLQKCMGDISRKYAVLEVVNDKFTWSVDGEQSPAVVVQIQKSALPADLSELNVTLNVTAVLRDHTARNVIAYIPAKKKTKKCFVFSAHYDHLGQMGSDTYFPGGNDNASGTAMLIELARYFKEHPGDVNVVFMAFAGEEAGLYGSHHYVDHPLFPLKNIQFLFNLDIMGSGEEGVTIVNGSVFQKEFDLLSSINSVQQFLPLVKIRGKAANSDHYFFSEAGVPAFFMYTMGPNKHYHDVGDTYENLSFSEFNDIFQLLVDFEEMVTKKSPGKATQAGGE